MKTNLLISITLVATFAFGVKTFGQKPTLDVAKIPAEGCVTLDGDLSEWATIDAVEFLGTWDAREPQGGAEDFSATFKMLWSDNGVYIAVDVIDDSNSPWQDGWADWDPDQIEVYFDPTGASESPATYADTKASQLRYSPGTTDVTADPLVLTGNNMQLLSDWGKIETSDSKVGEDIRDDGYTAEIFIHFNDINPDGLDNVPAEWGFAASAGDADIGEESDKRWVTYIWGDMVDGKPSHSQDAGQFGIITLLADEYCPTTAINTNRINTISVYPNPVTDNLFIPDYTGAVKIYSLLGQKVMELEYISGSVNITSLESSIYIIETDKGISKFIKK